MKLFYKLLKHKEEPRQVLSEVLRLSLVDNRRCARNVLVPNALTRSCSSQLMFVNVSFADDPSRLCPTFIVTIRAGWHSKRSGSIWKMASSKVFWHLYSNQWNFFVQWIPLIDANESNNANLTIVQKRQSFSIDTVAELIYGKKICCEQGTSNSLCIY